MDHIIQFIFPLMMVVMVALTSLETLLVSTITSLGHRRTQTQSLYLAFAPDISIQLPSIQAILQSHSSGMSARSTFWMFVRWLKAPNSIVRRRLLFNSSLSRLLRPFRVTKVRTVSLLPDRSRFLRCPRLRNASSSR